jgi:hydroxymethylpyrimidine kinase/phosphomethylpyrimidine kinase
VLSIAGTDPLRGAGIDADCWTALQHQCQACWVQTCVVDQDSTGVFVVERLPVEGLRRRLRRTLDDTRPSVWKLGLAPGADVVDLVSELAMEYRPSWLVIDPVLRGGTASAPELADPGIVPALWNLGRACVRAGIGVLITPNAPELAALTGAPDPRDPTQLTELANALSTESGMSVLAKGGHLPVGRGHDVLVHQGVATSLQPGVMRASDIHGTGCHLSAAIAAGLAHDGELSVELVEGARRWLRALPVVQVGRGRVQFDHMRGGLR